MTKYVEILVTFSELTIDPESPYTGFWASQHDCPTTFIIDLDRMLVKGWAIPNRASFHSILTRRRHVHVAALNHACEETPRMVVRMPQIIAVEPVMDSDGEEPEVKDPPYEVRTVFWT